MGTETEPKLTSIADLDGIDKQALLVAQEDIPLLEEIDTQMRAENKPDAKRSSGYYSPSALPYCGRAMFYQRTGVCQKECLFPQTRMIFEIGHAVHGKLQDYIIKALGADAFRVEVFCKDDKLHLMGSADGLLEISKQRRLLEIKSISGKGFDTLASPKAAHRLQAHCYAHMLDTPLLWYLYYDKSTGNRRLFSEAFDKKVWGKVLDKLERVERCVQVGNPPPKEKGWGCQECKFSWTCHPGED